GAGRGRARDGEGGGRDAVGRDAHGERGAAGGGTVEGEPGDRYRVVADRESCVPRGRVRPDRLWGGAVEADGVAVVVGLGAGGRGGDLQRPQLRTDHHVGPPASAAQRDDGGSDREKSERTQTAAN